MTARGAAAVLLGLAALAVVAVLAVAPPPARPADAPAESFSAARASEHVAQIAQRPHPVGFDDHARVRDYLVSAARAAGAEAGVVSGEAVRTAWGSPFPAARLANVIARVPGTAPELSGGKALLVVAHYDSVATGPGAADDGAAVAAMLEAIRALRASGGVRNDVLFLFTDGEEPGLLGATMFVDEGGLDDIGAVLNLEARGSRGPVFMFQTGRGNHPLVRAFAAATGRPVTNSLTDEVYQQLPNDTDFTVFLEGGATGLNSSFIEGFHDYHAPTDTVDRLDRDSLQHHGENLLGLVRVLGETDLRTLRGDDAVYFDVLARAVVHYPQRWAAPLAVVTVLALVVLVGYGARRGALRPCGVLVVAGVGFGAVLAAVVASYGLWLLALVLRPDLAAMPGSEPYQRAGFAAGFSLVALVALLLASLLLRRRLAGELLAGGLVVLAVLLLVTAFTLAGMSYLMQWPVLAGLPALWWLARRPAPRAAGPAEPEPVGPEPAGSEPAEPESAEAEPEPAGLGGLLLAALPPVVAILLFASVADNLFVALGIALGAVGVAFIVLGGLVLLPLLAALPRLGLLSGAAALAAAGVLGASVIDSGFSTEQPRPNALTYVLDAAEGKALWLSNDPRPDAWTGQALGEQPARMRAVTYLPRYRDRMLMTAPARTIGLAPPVVERLSDTVAGGTRTVRFRAASRRDAWLLEVRLPAEPLRACTVAGKRIEGDTLTRNADRTGGVVFDLYGAGPQGFELSCEVDAAAPPLRVEVFDHTVGLSPEVAALVAPRPPTTVPTWSGRPSDLVIVRQLVTL